MSNKRMAEGLSIVEILITLTVIGIILMPLSLSFSQTALLQNNLSIKNMRNLAISSQAARVSAALNDYNVLYNNLTSIATQNGVTLNTLFKTNSATNNIFNRQGYLYSYVQSATGTNWSDAIPINSVRDNFLLDVGNTTSDWTDSLNNHWAKDQVYSQPTDIAGFISGYGGIVPTPSSANLTNTLNDTLYQTYREGSDLRFRFTVPNTYKYVVDIYTAELDTTIDDTVGKRRRMDIMIDAVATGDELVATDVSPYVASGGHNKAIVLRYVRETRDVSLDIRIKKSASSDFNPQIMGIAITPVGF
jgi:hypothetical protein